MTLTRSHGGLTSPTKIIANIFISFIGAGMLGLPFAFREAGILEGALIMSVVGYLSVEAMLMLIDCKYAVLSGRRPTDQSFSLESKEPLISTDMDDEEFKDNKESISDLTYGDLGLYAIGYKGKQLVDGTIIASQIGFCCGYLIYLCQNLSEHMEGLTRGQWLVLLLPPLYGLTLLRHLNKLAVFSIFAQISNVFALAVVFWFDFSHSEEVKFRVKEFSLKGFPFFFAVAIYCYEGAGMILSLEESMAAHKKHVFRPVFVGTMIVLTFLYIAFGASGYLSFGPHTEEIITLNLPHGKTAIDFAALVKICLGVALFFTYPMMLFPVTHLIDKTFGYQKDLTKGNMVRLVIVLTTGLVVIAIPNFAILAGLIGATCCTLLAFIMPAVFHMSIFKGKLTKSQRYFDYLLIFLGVSGSIIGLMDAMQRISESRNIVETSPVANVPNIIVNASHPATTVTPVVPTKAPEIVVTLSEQNKISNLSNTSVKPTVDNNLVTKGFPLNTPKPSKTELKDSHTLTTPKLPKVENPDKFVQELKDTSNLLQGNGTDNS